MCLDVEPNVDSRLPVPAVCRILCSNVRGLSQELNDLTLASSQFDIFLCPETMVSHLHHISHFLVPGFVHSTLFCRHSMPRAQGLAVYTRNGYGAFIQPQFECGCEMLVFRVCGT